MSKAAAFTKYLKEDTIVTQLGYIMIDLFNIHKSKLRRDLFRLYFNHPEKEYYIRELARILERPPAYVRRELMILQKSGLFTSEMKGNQKYFKLNDQYPLYKEIKSIISKTLGIEKSLRNIIEDTANIEMAFVFGSFAKGEEDMLSDIDMMIIGNPDEDEFIEKVSKLETEISREINYHIYSQNDFEGRIREEEPFINNVIKSDKIFLKGAEDDLQRIAC
ncbi:hypothetical protein LCGC14_1927760 [marine sediment metagenome]|uniref:HTH arsR-type domain-containing protein n=1 Tax=marine sediment metagenome TaxID=412755 RepID=A0A0F9GC72_9ZZZZ